MPLVWKFDVSIWHKEFVLTVAGIWIHWLGKETVCTVVYWVPFVLHLDTLKFPGCGLPPLAYTSKGFLRIKRVKSAEHESEIVYGCLCVCVLCQDFFPRCKKLHSCLGQEKLVPGHVAWCPGGGDLAFVASHHSEWHLFTKVCNVGHLPTADEDDLRVQTPSGFGWNYSRRVGCVARSCITFESFSIMRTFTSYSCHQFKSIST